MGCNTSKLDLLPAVSLCRDRCKFLEEALRQSYALADAHVAYMESLKTLGPALHCFFDQIQHEGDQCDPPINGDRVSPKSQPSKLSPPDHSTSSSNSDSQNQLHSESIGEAADKDFQFPERSRFEALTSTSDSNLVYTDDVQQLYYAYSPAPPNSSNYLASEAPWPPPPTNSAWDFFNVFQSFEEYEARYSPSRDTKEVKEEKEKFIQNLEHEAKSKIDGIEKSGEEHGDAKESEVDLREEVKNSVSEKERSESKVMSDSATVEASKGFSEVMIEIQSLFEKASESGNEVLEMLDFGKLRYHQKIAVTPVSCKLLNVFTPSSSLLSSQYSTVKAMEPSVFRVKMGHDDKGVDKDMGLSLQNLSSSLRELCVWEKKLYDEVKAEEKLRILHEKKFRQLRRMDKKGADAQKLDSVQTFIRIISTKMKVSIQIVDRISGTINKLREEYLWPQINKLILRFVGMWKDMLVCHRCQYQAIAEAKSSGAFASNRKLSNAHLDAAIKLKFEIHNWKLSFLYWIHAQKAHVKALNGWLLRCLMHYPEETPGSTAPLSPSSVGASPVFVICNEWSQAVDTLSEKEVTEAFQGFIISVNELLEQNVLDLQQKLTTDKELGRKVKVLGRQEQKMQKLVQAHGKKVVTLLPMNIVHCSELSTTSKLESGLEQIFAAVEGFAANTLQAYEKLSIH